jgi:ribonuclease P protein component
VVHVISNSNLVSRVGLTIGRGIGGSVVRHRTARRLREVVRRLLPTMPRGFDVVVRCLPGAGTATFDELSRDVEQALASAFAKQVAQ